MKKTPRFFFIGLALIALFISACGGAVAAPSETSSGSGRPQASLVEFSGVIEAMDGNQWTVNGQMITVDDSILREGPFAVGDSVKVEAEVRADGSIIVTRVERPSAADDNSNDDNSNDDNSNDGNSNDDNSNSGNSNDDNSNDDDDNSNSGNSNDDNSNDDDDNSNDSNSNDDNSNDDDDDSNDNDSGNDNDDDSDNSNDDDDDDGNEND